MNRRLFFTFLLICISCFGIFAKRVVVDELSLPIDAYMTEADDKKIKLNPYGELVVRLVYWDTFSNSNNNNYTIEFKGYPDASRSTLPTLFNSDLTGRSQKEVNQNSWGNTYYYERTDYDDSIKHFIAFSNGTWTTRIALFYDGHIGLTYGRKTDAGPQEHWKGIELVVEEDTWKKLLNFVRKAHNHNIGKTQ